MWTLAAPPRTQPCSRALRHAFKPSNVPAQPPGREGELFPPEPGDPVERKGLGQTLPAAPGPKGAVSWECSRMKGRKRMGRK